MIELRFRGFSVRATFAFFAVVGLTASLGGAVQTQLLTVLLCSLMHELGHILAMCLFRIPPASVTFYAGGIMLPGGSLNCSRLKTCAVLAAGPAVNLCASAASILSGSPGIFAAAGLLLGLFNLLPFRSFDGGRLYLELTGSEPPAALQLICVLPLAAAAVYSCLCGRVPVSLTVTAMLIVADSL